MAAEEGARLEELWAVEVPGARRLAVAGERLVVLDGQALRVLRGQDGRELPAFPGEVRLHGGVALSPDGERLVVLDERFGLEASRPRGLLVEVGPEGEALPLALPPHRHGRPTFSPDGDELRVVATVGREGPKVVRFDGRTGALRGMSRIPLEFVVPLLSADGALVVHRSGPGEVAVADVDQGRALARVEVAAYDPVVAAFAPDGRRVLIGSQGRGSAEGVDLRTGEVRSLLRAGEESLRAVAASPDAGWLAAAGVRGTLHVWEVESWRRVVHARVPDLVELGFLSDGSLGVRTLRPRIERPSENFVRRLRVP